MPSRARLTITSRSGRLLAWFDRNRRDLPWRARPGEPPDPYRVWLSEIMLQQTTVATVARRWDRFVGRFPDIGTLAAAPWEDVAAAWAGLGYYARARNLHAAARQIAAAGFPPDERGWRALPGVGAYTAAAIAAIARGQPSVAVDGNVLRVMARLEAVAAPLPASRRTLAKAAATLMADEAARARPGDAVQALFDLGAGICTPRRPACARCPLAGDCAAHAGGQQDRLPVRAPRRERPALAGAVFWVEDFSGRVWLRRRPPQGLLGGMLELPGSEWRAGMTLAEAAGFAPVPAAWRVLGEVRHVFTHFSLLLAVLAARVEVLAPPPGAGTLVPREAVLAAGLPSVMAKAARLALEEFLPGPG